MISQKRLFSNQRRIGLTGGIASGKTTIANYLNKKKDIKILDADEYARKYLKNGTETYRQIITHFGKQIIDRTSPENIINKNLLKKIIFNNSLERKWLENLLHPLIKKKMETECKKLSSEKTLLLVIPLLFEAGFEDLCTEIWLVKCPKSIQLERLKIRDKISEKEAKKIINLQSNYIDKEIKSNVIIENDEGQNKWQKQIKNLI